ncbi:MAG TPA: SAM-dependent methyltransferase [Solirubrobacteraceae bacterium]|nr:SAM-dependent methyltransferase [Solirubrobacteraceae bacterium]
MSKLVPRARIGREFFEDLYARAEDPWDFATSAYEREKYGDTLGALGGARFKRGLEVGCSIGVFTEQLAEVCDEVLGIDVSEHALARAHERLGKRPNVTLKTMTFPEQMPGGPWDLVVCSEVLYYLDDAAFARAVERLRAALAHNATVLAVHWRPPTSTYPLLGDEVHDRLIAQLGDWHVLDRRRSCYRLDRFEAR